MGLNHSCVYYLESLLNPQVRKDTVKRVTKILKEFDKVRPFDAIAVSGMSGALIGSTIADRLGKGIIVVRKEDDTSTHSWYKVEGAICERYIIIDDLIASGKTVRRIIDQIKKEQYQDAKCVGIYLYYDRENGNTKYMTKAEEALVIPNRVTTRRGITWATKLPTNFSDTFPNVAGNQVTPLGLTVKVNSSPSHCGTVASSSATNDMTGVPQNSGATSDVTTLGPVSDTEKLPATVLNSLTEADLRLSARESGIVCESSMPATVA
jgi:adenine/guanine phosphoribosyltransferase-like PRPP-binding protein